MQHDSFNNRVIDQAANVAVSAAQVRVGDRSYDLAEIDTVSLQRPLLRRTYGYAAIALGVVLAVIGYIVWDGTFLTPVLGGLALIIVGIVLSAILRPHYTVRLNHHGGDVTTVPFADGADAERIVTAISNAKNPRR